MGEGEKSPTDSTLSMKPDTELYLTTMRSPSELKPSQMLNQRAIQAPLCSVLCLQGMELVPWPHSLYCESFKNFFLDSVNIQCISFRGRGQWLISCIEHSVLVTARALLHAIIPPTSPPASLSLFSIVNSLLGFAVRLFFKFLGTFIFFFMFQMVLTNKSQVAEVFIEDRGIWQNTRTLGSFHPMNTST